MGVVDHLTRRESATLDAVARRLTNAEIAAELHVSVRTVESHIAALRRKLAVESRPALIEAALARRSAGVPVPPGPFVGRRSHVDALQQSLVTHRWVTIVGPAGVGKTRLALEIAAAGPRVPVVVELEHATGRGVGSAVAKAVGMTGEGSTSLVSQCAIAMDGHPHLLVLDNCDRVLDAVAGVVEELLAASRSLTVLATSRTPVGASDESIHTLEPLRTDGPGSAQELFTGRARAVLGGVVPASGEDAGAVARICRRLDGLPLAIELATARLRHLSLGELESLLDDGFGALDRARPDTRHRTLETAFDWTWDLLDDQERSVLSGLAALPRTFDLDLVDAVVAPGSGAVVLRLLDRSLVAAVRGRDGTHRFRLLDALREFVVARTPAPELDRVRRAHARHFDALAGELAARARTDDSRSTAARAAANCVDVNAAAHWALEHEPALAVSLATSLAVGAEQFNPDVDSLTTIAAVARDPAARDLATTRDLLCIGIAMSYWDVGLLGELAGCAVERTTDAATELEAHHLAGYADAYRHRPAAALEHLHLAERLAVALGDDWQLGSVQQAMGIALRDGRPEEAIGWFEASIAAYARAGDSMHVNNVRYMMASTAAGAGVRTAEARTWADECVAYATECSNQHELAHAMLTTSALSTRTGPDPALDEAIEEFRTVGDLRCLTRGLLLQASRRPVAERVPLLRQAHDVAVRARDEAHQVLTTERLVQALWESGAHRLAVVELGALVHLVGEDAARSRCPRAMLRELEHWGTTLAEGRARAARVR